jgi:hypothetical protein
MIMCVIFKVVLMIVDSVHSRKVSIDVLRMLRAISVSGTTGVPSLIELHG